MAPAIVISLIVLYFLAILMLIRVGLRLARVDARQRADIARALGGVYMEDKFVESLA